MIKTNSLITTGQKRIVCRLGLLPACLTGACLTVDGFFFDHRPVDEYRWDDEDPCDPQLQGELVEHEHRLEGGPPPSCHPSRVPPGDRTEGFTTLADGRTLIHGFSFYQLGDGDPTLMGLNEHLKVQ